MLFMDTFMLSLMLWMEPVGLFTVSHKCYAVVVWNAKLGLDCSQRQEMNFIIK